MSYIPHQSNSNNLRWSEGFWCISPAFLCPFPVPLTGWLTYAVPKNSAGWPSHSTPSWARSCLVQGHVLFPGRQSLISSQCKNVKGWSAAAMKTIPHFRALDRISRWGGLKFIIGQHLLYNLLPQKSNPHSKLIFINLIIYANYFSMCFFLC